MRFFILLVVLFAVSVQADWWDSFTNSVSNGLTNAAGWVKETAGPTVRDKFNDAKESLQDPETHKTIREWITDKAEKVSEFTQTEVVPELKKIYNAAVADDTETTTYSDDIIIH